MSGLDKLPLHGLSHIPGGSDAQCGPWVTPTMINGWASDPDKPVQYRLVHGLEAEAAVSVLEWRGRCVGPWGSVAFAIDPADALYGDAFWIMAAGDSGTPAVAWGALDVSTGEVTIGLISTTTGGESGGGGGAIVPGSAAGGVLSGTYPNPGFAVDMATQAELDAHITDATDAHDGSAISIVDTGGYYTSTDVEGALQEIGSGGVGGGAPSNASYVTTASEAGLSAEKVLGADVIMSGLASARPAAAVAGRIYLATDTNGGTIYRDTGSAWVQMAAGVSAGGAPSSASYVTAAAEAGLSGEYVLGGDVIMRGSSGSRPAAGTAGRLWVSTDVGGGTLYRDNGSSWDQIAAGVTAAAPSSASFVTYAAEAGLSAEAVLGGDVIMRGLASARPTAAVAGKLWTSSDVNGGTLYRDSGSAWQQIAAGVSEVTDHLADTSDAHDASAISIVDTGNYFTGSDVEAALQQIGSGSGGALGGRLIKLADTTLGSPAANIDLTSLATTYAHLIILAFLRCTTSATTQDCTCRLNNDSGANYDQQFVNANGTTITAIQQFGNTGLICNEIPAATATADTFGAVIIEVVNYASGKNAAGFMRTSRKIGTASGNMRVFHIGWWYRSNTAISRVTFAPGANNFDTGTRVTVMAVDAS